MTDRSLILKNVGANTVRIVSAGGVQIAVPLLLDLLLPTTLYTAWALTFSISTYIAYFDVGVPTSTQVLVAGAAVSGDINRLRSVVGASVKLTASVSGCLLIAGTVLSISLGTVVPGMSPSLRMSSAVCLLLLITGQLASLMSVTLGAYFAGLQRNKISAIVLVPAQLASLALAASLAAVTRSLPLIAAGYAVPLVIGCVILYASCYYELASRRREVMPTPHPLQASGDGNFEAAVTPLRLLRHSGPLVLWSLCTLVSLGVGTFVVGRFAYRDVTPYALASILGSGISGIVGALATPLLPEFARTHALNPQALGRKVLTSTRVHSSALFITAIWTIAIVPWYSRALLGSSAAQSTQVWLTQMLLVGGMTLHLAGTPPALAFIATGTHQRIVWPPIVQAALSLAVSVALVNSLGAVGVAIGVASGATVATIVMCAWSIRRADIAGLRGLPLFEWLVATPSVGLGVAAGPVALMCATGVSETPVGVAVAFSSACCATAWEILVVLPATERRHMVLFVSQRLGLRKPANVA